MAKSPDAFRTISEVADWMGVQTHVLRFWESKFSQVKPVKRAGGRRYYRPADMLLLGGIRKLLHDDGMTIKAVQDTLREQGVNHVADHSAALDDLSAAQLSSEVVRPPKADVSTIVPFEPPKSVEKPAQVATPTLALDENLEQQASAQAPLNVAETEAAPAPQTPAPQAPAETVATPEIEAPKIPEPIAPQQPKLPSFMQSATKEDTITTEPSREETTEAEPVVKSKTPRVIDVPDAPADANVDLPPGLLAQVASLRHIPAGQVNAIRAAYVQLENLQGRLSGTRKE